MVKGFVAGVLWGGVVAGAGLGVVSVMAPMKPTPEVVAEAAKVEEPSTPAVAEAKPAEVTEPKAEAAAPEAETSAAPATAPVAAEAKPEEPAPLAKPAETAEPVQTALAEPAPQPETSPVAETETPLPVSPAPSEVAATPPVAEAPVPALPEANTAPLAEPSDASPQTDPAPIPASKAKVEANETLLTPTPEVAEPKPATISPDPVLPTVEKAAESSPEGLPDPAPEPAAEGASQPEAPVILAPAPGLKDEVAGVTTGRLPSIGVDKAEAEAAPEAAADLPAYRRFARSFDNVDGKPLFSILLIDPGTPDMDRAQLAALSFPVTFVVDPLAENAAQAAATYRAAGQEVVMLATGIPKGAKASDLEQTFAAYATALPEAVAVLDLGAGGFQDDRGLATDVVGLIKAQGRGVLTYDRGLNAADQVARRDAVPAGLVFRSLDDEGEDAPLIRRYLDRAAFKAAQEGRVVVVGTARPETIAALLEWTVEGRASSVALAPATAVLSVE